MGGCPSRPGTGRWAGVRRALIDNDPNHLQAGFRQRLYDHTGGNPLFTVELLDSFKRQGMLAQDEAGHWIETAGLDWDFCPPLVEAVITGHLAGLADEDLELLQVAAVQGEQFGLRQAAPEVEWIVTVRSVGYKLTP